MLRLDGTVGWGPLTPGAIAAQYDTFRYLDGQWAGWDADVENVRYRLGWSTRRARDSTRRRKGDRSRQPRSMRAAVCGGEHDNVTEHRLDQGHGCRDSGPATAAKYSGRALPTYARSRCRSWATGIRVFRSRGNAQPDARAADVAPQRRLTLIHPFGVSTNRPWVTDPDAPTASNISAMAERFRLIRRVRL